jgi:hypothetical protein
MKICETYKEKGKYDPYLGEKNKSKIPTVLKSPGDGLSKDLKITNTIIPNINHINLILSIYHTSICMLEVSEDGAIDKMSGKKMNKYWPNYLQI